MSKVGANSSSDLLHQLLNNAVIRHWRVTGLEKEAELTQCNTKGSPALTNEPIVGEKEKLRRKRSASSVTSRTCVLAWEWKERSWLQSWQEKFMNVVEQMNLSKTLKCRMRHCWEK